MILIFGSHGQLGSELKAQMGEAPQHVFLHRESQDYCGDLENTAGIIQRISELKPEIIINAAAYTAVDKAESDRDRAQLINAKAVGAIAKEAAKINSLLIHYSTDYVFDGKKDSPYLETDGCNPISVYGKTKLQGEIAITESGAKHYILRTSWVYSPHGNNFLTTMLRLMHSREELKVVSDQSGVPTSVEFLAGITLDLIHQATPDFLNDAKPAAFGIYHCTPRGETTWFDYARLILETAKAHGETLTCRKIMPIAAKDYPTAAARPQNSRLNTDKLQKALSRELPDWQEDVIMAVGRALSDTTQDD